MTAVLQWRKARWLVVAGVTTLFLAIPMIATNTTQAIAPTLPLGASAGGGGGDLPSLSPAASSMQLGAAQESGRAPEAAPGTGRAQDAVVAAERAAAGSTQLAVAVLDRGTGEVARGQRADEPYFTASLAKVVVAVDMFDRSHTDGLEITDADRDLLRRALGRSDDDAMNELWVRFDGLGAAARVSQRLGLDRTKQPRDPGQWGQMSVSATDMALIWRYILDDMPAGDREFLVEAMSDATPTAADGFDQAFGLLSPAVRARGTVAKQGWMCCPGGAHYLHSAGAAGPGRGFVVVVLTRHPGPPGWDEARAEVTKITTAAVRALG